jgi:hypothetical protein
MSARTGTRKRVTRGGRRRLQPLQERVHVGRRPGRLVLVHSGDGISGDAGYRSPRESGRHRPAIGERHVFGPLRVRSLVRDRRLRPLNRKTRWAWKGSSVAMVFEASSRVDLAVQRCPARLQRFRG